MKFDQLGHLTPYEIIEQTLIPLRRYSYQRSITHALA